MRILIVGAGIAGPDACLLVAPRWSRADAGRVRVPASRGGYLVDFWGAGFEVAERMGIVPELTTLAAFPRLAALIRNWIAVSGNPVLEQAQQDLEETVMPWIEEVLTAGQAIGAVRTDLPPGLLIAVVAGMGQAMDTWLLTQQLNDADLPPLIGHLIAMIRRAVEPLDGPLDRGTTGHPASTSRPHK
jgi:hypothetical protein